MSARHGSLIVVMAVSILLLAAPAASSRAQAGMTFLDNGRVRVGVDLDDGAKIAFLAPSAGPRSGVNLVLSDGSSIRADRVVLATGHLPPAIPGGIGADVVSDRRFVADPWEPGWAIRVSREAPVLFLGSGLTMIDAVLELRGAGHTGPLRAISRHGHVPGSHRGLAREPGRLAP